MMPQGNPIGFGLVAKAAQAYAYALLRGGDEAAAQRAALVHVTVAQLADAIEMATHARQAAQELTAVQLGDPGVYAEQAGLAAVPGGTTTVLTVAVLRERPDGRQSWTTVQLSVPAGSSMEDALAEINAVVGDLPVPSGGDTGGTVVRWEAQTVITHTPGGP